MVGNFWNLVIKGIDETKLIRFNLGWGDKALKGEDEEEEDGEGGEGGEHQQ